MKGQIGHAVEVRNAVDAKAEAAKKLAKAGGGRRRPSAREQRRRSKQKPSKHSNGAVTAPANQVHTGRACCVASRQSKSQQCRIPSLLAGQCMGSRASVICHVFAGWPCLLNRSVRQYAQSTTPTLVRPFCGQDEGVDARMLSALVAGVRRAFPFVAPDAVEPLIDAHAGALFRVCHTASFGVAVQCLMLLFQLMAARRAVSDRFYRCADPQLV